jgi:hypothetical protein
VTVNATATYEFTIAKIVRNAHIIASLMNPSEPTAGPQWDAQLVFGAQCLEAIMKDIEAEGKLVRARKFLNVTMVASQIEYTLGSDIMDVFEDGAFITEGDDVDAPNGTTPVKQIDMEMWQRISSQGATGRPVFYFCYRAADPLTIRVWPAPAVGEEGTIRLQVYRFLGQNSDTTKTPDLERYWANFLIHAVAAQLAEAANQPSDKVMRLEAKAAQYLQKAKSYSHQRTQGQVFMAHRGPQFGGRRHY